MRVVILGYGVQGKKRKTVAGTDVVAVIDPVAPEADHDDLSDLELDDFDAALVCTPDSAKPELLESLLAAGKHVMVEKPVILAAGDYDRLAERARESGAVCYTAYNHRFEPLIQRLREILDRRDLGRIYSLRLFYGNGTARLVRDSRWRDQGSGVLADLGSHLLDLHEFWFDGLPDEMRVASARGFENNSFDHVLLTGGGKMLVQMEMTLLSWKNQFSCDVIGERGSAHLVGLPKWGDASLTVRHRILPSGVPEEEIFQQAKGDVTWAAEYDHFLDLCRAAESGWPFCGLDRDRRIAAMLDGAHQEACS